MDLSEVNKFEQKQTLKLSDAILAGCKLKPVQCRGNYFHGENEACVIGAAYYALTGSCYMLLDHEIFYLPNRILGGAISQNDFGGRTREEIAAWVASEGY